MKKQLFFLFLFIITVINANEIVLKSPDNKTIVTIDLSSKITYKIKYNGKEVLSPSSISMTLSGNEVLGKNPVLSSKKVNTINETINQPFGKQFKTLNNCNELQLNLGKYSVIFRAYNNGIAYRFVTTINENIIVLSEEANFNFPEDYSIYFPEVKNVVNAFEENYLYKKISEFPNGSFAFCPVLAEIKEGPKLLITESDLLDYAGMFVEKQEGFSLKGKFAAYPKKEITGGYNNFNLLVPERYDYIAITKGNRSFPWRIIAIEENDAKFLENDLVWILASPSKIKDISWIKPGKTAWDWWCAWNLDMVDFKTGINNETYKYFIDFAAKNKIEYIIMDEGWSIDTNLLELTNVDVPMLVKYGKERNVGVILWCVWHTLDRQKQVAFAQFEKWGVAGLKIDFMDRDDQKVVNFYEDICKMAAEKKMLIDYHGAFKETGLRRTYPNLINREGILGAEYNKWSSKVTPEHNVTIPYIRMFTGPMDYTPGSMKNVGLQKYFIPIGNKPQTMGTRCHQLGMYIVYYAPLQMLADAPTAYEREPMILDFLSTVPTVWDTTIAINGKVSDYIVVARKNKNDWYVGGMTDWTERDITFKTDFLKDGNYVAEIYRDGINTSENPTDYKKETKEINKESVLTIKMVSGGGFAIIIKKI